MDKPQKSTRIDPPGVTVDLLEGDCAYQIKRGIRERSRLRGMVMDLADVVATVASLKRCHLVLMEPALSSETIADVWSGAERVFQPSVLGRLAITEARMDEAGRIRLRCHSGELPVAERKRIEQLVLENGDQGGVSGRPAPGHSVHEILRVLVVRWLTQASPEITLTQLGEETGYTYKPVRQALDRLSKQLVNHGHRGVALKSFPREAWSRLLLETDSVRETKFFHPEGERPRTPASLLERFHRIPADEVAHVGIGGVEGARVHAPDLDMIGLPRLDLTVHCPGGEPDLEFVRRLDPALSLVEDPLGPCSLVVHLLRRPLSYFEGRVADPAECLLDLQEMRLEAQARRFLRSFPTAKGEDF